MDKLHAESSFWINIFDKSHDGNGHMHERLPSAATGAPLDVLVSVAYFMKEKVTPSAADAEMKWTALTSRRDKWFFTSLVDATKRYSPACGAWNPQYSGG